MKYERHNPIHLQESWRIVWRYSLPTNWGRNCTDEVQVTNNCVIELRWLHSRNRETLPIHLGVSSAPSNQPATTTKKRKSALHLKYYYWTSAQCLQRKGCLQIASSTQGIPGSLLCRCCPSWIQWKAVVNNNKRVTKVTKYGIVIPQLVTCSTLRNINQYL